MIFLITFIGLFLIVQAITPYFERYHLLAAGWLFLITTTALVVGLSSVFVARTAYEILLSAVCFVLVILFGALLVLKLNLSHNWNPLSRHSLLLPTVPDFPHDLFSVRTLDGVVIKGYHMHVENNQQLKSSVVIMAHGGFDSKDILAQALLAVWLSKEFDVIGFDFRGHGESGGKWTGDGKTVADLKAVVDFARQKGYQRVGVYGQSMGGWTAVLEAVDYHDVDAIVIAGMPPGFFSEVPVFSGRTSILKYPGADFLLRVVMGVRFEHYEDIRSPIKEIGGVSPVPLLILFNQADPGAGVAGVPGYWESIPLSQREPTFRGIQSLPFTAQQVYEAAREPKELCILPGAVHVYSLGSTRELFTQVERWFKRYLV